MTKKNHFQSSLSDKFVKSGPIAIPKNASNRSEFTHNNGEINSSPATSTQANSIQIQTISSKNDATQAIKGTRLLEIEESQQRKNYNMSYATSRQ